MFSRISLRANLARNINKMTKTNTVECNQVLWVVGAIERLATLGMLKTPPLVVSSGAIDLFIDLDDARYVLFPDNQVIANQFLTQSLQIYQDLDLQEQAKEISMILSDI